jgi:hypothetical protein
LSVVRNEAPGLVCDVLRMVPAGACWLLGAVPVPVAGAVRL